MRLTFAAGACDACHTSVDEKKHTFRLNRVERELCVFCHVDKQVGKVIHKPITEGQCLGCHNPHGAASREMLRAADMGKLCASCHGDVSKGRKQMHGPVASGYCASCHNSHASDYPKLLVAEGRAFVALKQWDAAAAVLEKAVRLNPEPREAWYALGQMHEAKGQWQQAAQAYRAAFESTSPGRLLKVAEPAAPPKP